MRSAWRVWRLEAKERREPRMKLWDILKRRHQRRSHKEGGTGRVEMWRKHPEIRKGNFMPLSLKA